MNTTTLTQQPTAASKGGDISARAMLVSLSISIFNPTRLDRRTTDEVTSSKGASRDAGDYRKRLVPKAVIDPAVKAANAVYIDHKRLTSPWADGGTRILCIDNFERYTDAINGGVRLFNVEVDRFLRHYEDIRATAPVRMGATYDPRDYPDIADVKSRFAVRTEWQPLPNGNDFRVHLQEDELNELRASVDERVEKAVQAAREDLHQRLKDTLSKVSERLAKPENIFRDSLIENVREVCKIIPSMCLEEDPQLLDAVEAAMLNVGRFDPQDLRDDIDKRAAAKKAADDILKSFGA